MIPSKRPVSACFRYSAFTSSTVTSRPTRTTRSVSEPVATGARTEIPSTFPFRSGMTIPIARAAPVEVGIRLIPAARARRRSLCGRSRTCWPFVYAWIVVMKPCSIVNASWRTLASGATQFVVQEAFEMMWCWSGSYSPSLTPITIVMSGFVAGAEIAVARLDLLAERAEHRVVLEQVRHCRRVAEVVDRHDLEVAAALQVRTEEVATDAAEAVDPDSDLRHLEFASRCFGFRRRVRARPATDSDPVRRHGPERGSTGGGGRPRSFPSGPPSPCAPAGGSPPGGVGLRPECQRSASSWR